MEVLATVLSGSLVLVIGQIVIRFFIDPIIRFKEELGEVSHVLLKYQSKIMNNNPSESLVDELKLRSSKLLASRQAIPFYSIIHKLVGLPDYDSVIRACRNLNGIAGNLEAKLHSVHGVPENPAFKNYEYLDEIKDLLRVVTTYFHG